MTESLQSGMGISPAVKNAVKEYCALHGLQIDRFIEEALIDRLEELEDIQDVKKLKGEPIRNLSEILPTEFK